jgi:hypothetical protein
MPRYNSGNSNRVVYDSVGTYTFVTPPNVTLVYVTMVGGGGGGASNGAGGGAGGAGICRIPIYIPPNSSVTLTVGSGGSTDTPGNASSFGSFITCPGGSAFAGTGGGTAPGGGTGGVNNGGNGVVVVFSPYLAPDKRAVSAGGGSWGGTAGPNNPYGSGIGKGGSSILGGDGTGYGYGGNPFSNGGSGIIIVEWDA